MFAIGTTEIVIIVVLALLLFGPQQLPEIGKQVGKAMREFRHMSGEMQRALNLDDAFHTDYDTTYHQHDMHRAPVIEPAQIAPQGDAPNAEAFAYSAPKAGTPFAAADPFAATAAELPAELPNESPAAHDQNTVGQNTAESLEPVSVGGARVYNEPAAAPAILVAGGGHASASV